MRQFICRNVSAQNFIWERYIRRAIAVGLDAGLEIASPLPGRRYKRRGLIGFGYDHSGHGESPTASRSALVVVEQLGNFITFPFVKTWPAGQDDKVVEMDLLGFWSYFRPDYAIGDAYGVGMLTSLNDRLFQLGLVDLDRRTVGDGDSTATTWSQWAFAPMRFEGMVKHAMASAVRRAFHNGQAAIPFLNEAAPLFERGEKIVELPASMSAAGDVAGELLLLARQLNNMKATPTKASYSTFSMADPKLGDDLFDAACAGVWALETRGMADAPTVITSRTSSREQLLGTVGRLQQLERREAPQ